MECAVWKIWAMGAAGVLAGAGVACCVLFLIFGRMIRRRDETIERLIWQAGEFERASRREQTRH